MLAKKLENQVTVKDDGQLEVRVTTVIIEDSVEISRSHARKVVDVGDDVTNEAQVVKDIASTIHTQARIDARQAVKDKQK